MSRCIRFACTTSWFCVALAATSAAAQVGPPQPVDQSATEPAAPSIQATANPQTVTESDIVVTGSLIRGSREDSAVPVDVVSERDLANQGSPSALDLIKNLSVSSGVVGDANQADARASGQEGVATINLRGLGPARTLVLLNGKRVVQAGLNIPAVDVNLLPSGAIGRVEILKDGAAATYGSDAIGGVVNFITREQEGFLFSGSYRYIDGSDGDYDVAGSYGHQGDGFSLMASFGHQHRSELRAQDRPYTLLAYPQNPQNGYTLGGAPGNYDFNGPTGGASYVRDLGCTGLGGFRSQPGSTTDRCYTQYGQFTNLVEPEDRYQAYVDFDVDLTSSIKFSTSLLYGWTTAFQTSSPSSLPAQAPSVNSAFGGTGSYVIPSYAPALRDYCALYGAAAGCSTDAAGNPTSNATTLPTLFRPVLLGGNPLFAQNGSRGSNVNRRESESLQLTAGLEVELTNSLRLDVGGTYSQYDRWNGSRDAFVDLLQNAFAGFGGANCAYASTASRAGLTNAQLAALAGTNGCTYFNPFSTGVVANAATGVANPNYVGTRSPSGANLTPGAGLVNDVATFRNFYKDNRQHAKTQLYVLDAVVSGNVGISLPGGEIGMALGGQYRKNTYSLVLDDTRNLAAYPCPGTPLNPAATCAQQTGALGFIGTDVNRSAANDVYAVFAELKLPIASFIDAQLSLRYEDYRGLVGSTLDPQGRVRIKLLPWLALRGGAGTTFRSPPAQSLTGNTVTQQAIGGTFRVVDISGSPTLRPESATTYNAGVLINAGIFSGSIDYFRYEFDGPIESEPVAGILNAMFGASGTANCGNPAYAALQARFTFTAAGCGLANVQRLRTFFVNTARVDTSGLDAQAQLRFPVADGDLTVGGSGTYTFEYKTGDQLVEGILVQPKFDGVGLLNYQTTAYPLPQFKGVAFLQGQWRAHNLRIQFNYIDGYTDQRGAAIFGPVPAALAGTAVTSGKNIKPWPTLDITYRVDLGTGTTLAVAGVNVLDREPPFARLDTNYDPFTASPLGATVKLSLSQKF